MTIEMGSLRLRPFFSSLAALGLVALLSIPAAAQSCNVTYNIVNSWSGGFQAGIVVANTGRAAIAGWTLQWSFHGNEQISNGWGGSVAQQGQVVTIANASFDPSIPSGGSVSGMGFVANSAGIPAMPGSFTLNGTVCDGASTPPSTSPFAGPFSWTSSGPLISAVSDSTHHIVAVKDPSVVFANNRWHVYATTSTGSAWSMMYINFPTWQQAAAAKPYYMDATPGFTGYHAAPEVFFFRPQNKWYLIFQSPQPQFSTTNDLGQPSTWTVPRNVFASQPANIPNWIDFWVLCDSANCFIFFTGDDGSFYRSQTTIQQFPNNFSAPVLVMKSTNRFDLFEASHTYFVKGLNKYLTLVEALDQSGRRYFRSFIADQLAGAWAPLPAADSGSQPFAGINNVKFASGVTPWTTDISHGEMIRVGFDETLTIDPSNLQFLYQGTSSHPSSYIQIPWQLGLLK